MKRLRVVIDGRMFQESGIGRYIRNLIDRLEALDKQNEYFILHLKSDYGRLRYTNNFHKVLADFPWYGVGEQIKLPKLLKLLKPDLVHFPHFNVPIFYQGKFIVTIHDLIHEHFQMRRATTLNPLFYKIKQFGYKTVFKKAVYSSAKILVPSNFVKNLLINIWQVDSNKIIVTPEAVDNKILSIEKKMNEGQVKWVMKKFNIKSPYLFYVGNAHPHKNLEGLIRVFNRLKETETDLSLVLSGSNHYFWQTVRQQFQHDSIVYTGYVSDEELAGLYKNAAVFIMPSLEEGFGIPILEAMACSCPVVASNQGSLPEVGAHAAVYFDPLDTSSMVNKITKVLHDKSFRNELVEKGKKRVKEFSWERLGRKTLEAYQDSQQ